MHLHGNANRHVRQNVRCNAAMQISADWDRHTTNTALILRSRRRRRLEGSATSAGTSFETPRERAAPQDEG